MQEGWPASQTNTAHCVDPYIMHMDQQQRSAPWLPFLLSTNCPGVPSFFIICPAVSFVLSVLLFPLFYHLSCCSLCSIICPAVPFVLSSVLLFPLFYHLSCCSLCPIICPVCSFHHHDRLGDLVVKVFASRAEDPGFESRLLQDFSGSSHTSDSKIGTPVATLPGASRCRVNAGTCQPGVSIL